MTVHPKARAGRQESMDAAKSRLDVLAQSKKLPKGMDKATVAQAQADLSALQSGWTSAVEQFDVPGWSGTRVSPSGGSSAPGDATTPRFTGRPAHGDPGRWLALLAG